MVEGIDTYKSVLGFEENQIREMRAFLQGAVYCWCKNCKGQWFAARDLVGGENYDWQGTPLYALFAYYRQYGDDADAIDEAGKAAGRLLLGVLIEDKRTYSTRVRFTREYLWTGEDVD